MVAGVKYEGLRACRAAGRLEITVLDKAGNWVSVRLCKRCAAPFVGDTKRARGDG